MLAQRKRKKKPNQSYEVKLTNLQFSRLFSSVHSEISKFMMSKVSKVPFVIFNNGHKYPILGLGTWKVSLQLFYSNYNFHLTHN